MPPSRPTAPVERLEQREAESMRRDAGAAMIKIKVTDDDADAPVELPTMEPEAADDRQVADAAESEVPSDAGDGDSDQTVSPPTPTHDLDRLIRTLDRRLLMLALGATIDEVAGLDGRGLDGRPLVDDGVVEVTMLVKGIDAATIRVTLRRLGVKIEGLSSAGIGGTMIVIGRVPIDRLLDLGELAIVRRVVPSSAG
jgi:hypothetical protein